MWLYLLFYTQCNCTFNETVYQLIVELWLNFFFPSDLKSSFLLLQSALPIRVRRCFYLMVGWSADATSVKLVFQEYKCPPPEALSLLSLSFTLLFCKSSSSASHCKCPPSKSVCFKRCYILDTADWPRLKIPHNLISQVLKETCWFLNWTY